MKKLIFFLIVLAIAVWLGLQIKNDPGFVLIAYKQWTVETPLWFACVAIIITFLLLNWLLRLLNAMGLIGKKVSAWSSQRKVRKAYQMTNKGLIELAEGKWRCAEKCLIKAVNNNTSPLINYLAAAQAAQAQEAYERRDDYLREAHKSTPEAEVAIGLTQAKLQLDHNQLEQSLASLRHLQGLVPNHAHVMKLLERLYIKLEDWRGLLELLPSLKRHKVYNEKKLNELEFLAFTNLLTAQLAKSDINVVNELWQRMSRQLRRNPDIIILYCENLIAANNAQEAEAILRICIHDDWNEQLLEMYGKLPADNLEQQLKVTEAWLKQYPENPSLLLTLGRLCIRSQLWGKAKTYLTNSLALQARTETYTELGQLYEHLGDMPAAMQAYRNAVKLA